MSERCSAAERRALAAACGLAEEPAGSTVQRKGDFVSCCFLVLCGHCLVIDEQEQEREQEREERAGPAAPAPGRLLGGELLQGALRWQHSLVAGRTQPLLLCSLPAHALARFLGRVGREPQSILDVFWRYVRVSADIAKLQAGGGVSAAEPLFYATEQLKAAGASTGPESPQEAADVPSLPPLSAGASIRVFQPGSDVFSQGDDRHFLFIVTQGECSLLRRVPRPSPPSVVEIDTGTRLFAGDFILLDGESREWVAQRKRTNLEVLPSGNEFLDAKGKPAWLWGQHRHSLRATTRVESVLLPLSTLADSYRVFTAVLTLAERKYPQAQLGDHELLQQHYSDEATKRHLKTVVRQHLSRG